nr:MAG: nonstructural protein [Riboviria sp.]WKV33904.1 MAG: RNA-dependent RNA polymerase [Riboviria sp.]
MATTISNNVMSFANLANYSDVATNTVLIACMRDIEYFENVLDRADKSYLDKVVSSRSEGIPLHPFDQELVSYNIALGSQLEDLPTRRLRAALCGACSVYYGKDVDSLTRRDLFLLARNLARIFVQAAIYQPLRWSFTSPADRDAKNLRRNRQFATEEPTSNTRSALSDDEEDVLPLLAESQSLSDDSYSTAELKEKVCRVVDSSSITPKLYAHIPTQVDVNRIRRLATSVGPSQSRDQLSKLEKRWSSIVSKQSRIQRERERDHKYFGGAEAESWNPFAGIFTAAQDVASAASGVNEIVQTIQKMLPSSEHHILQSTSSERLLTSVLLDGAQLLGNPTPFGIAVWVFQQVNKFGITLFSVPRFFLELLAFKVKGDQEGLQQRPAAATESLLAGAQAESMEEVFMNIGVDMDPITAAKVVLGGAAVLASLVVGATSIVSQGSRIGLFSKIVRMSKDISGLKGGLYAIVQMVSDFRAHIDEFVVWMLGRDTAYYSAQQLLKGHSDDPDEFLASARELVHPEFREMHLSRRTYAKDLSKHIEILRAALGSPTVQGLHTAHVHQFNLLLNDLRSAQADAIRRSQALTTRDTPLHVSIVGKTQSGKTIVTDALARTMCATLKQRGYPVGELDRAIACLNLLGRHLDGYYKQFCVRFDDLGQKTSDHGETASAIINMVSAAPCVTQQAALENKGMTFESRLIISSANEAYPKVEGIACMEAYWRRRHLLYEMDNPTQDFEGVKTATFQRLDPIRPGGKIGSPISYPQLVVECLQKFSEHSKIDSQIQNGSVFDLTVQREYLDAVSPCSGSLSDRGSPLLEDSFRPHVDYSSPLFENSVPLDAEGPFHHPLVNPFAASAFTSEDPLQSYARFRYNVAEESCEMSAESQDLAFQYASTDWSDLSALTRACLMRLLVKQLSEYDFTAEWWEGCDLWAPLVQVNTGGYLQEPYSPLESFRVLDRILEFYPDTMYLVSIYGFEDPFRFLRDALASLQDRNDFHLHASEAGFSILHYHVIARTLLDPDEDAMLSPWEYVETNGRRDEPGWYEDDKVFFHCGVPMWPTYHIPEPVPGDGYEDWTDEVLPEGAAAESRSDSEEEEFLRQMDGNRESGDMTDTPASFHYLCDKWDRDDQTWRVFLIMVRSHAPTGDDFRQIESLIHPFARQRKRYIHKNLNTLVTLLVEGRYTEVRERIELIQDPIAPPDFDWDDVESEGLLDIPRSLFTVAKHHINWTLRPALKGYSPLFEVALARCSWNGPMQDKWFPRGLHQLALYVASGNIIPEKGLSSPFDWEVATNSYASSLDASNFVAELLATYSEASIYNFVFRPCLTDLNVCSNPAVPGHPVKLYKRDQFVLAIARTKTSLLESVASAWASHKGKLLAAGACILVGVLWYLKTRNPKLAGVEESAIQYSSSHVLSPKKRIFKSVYAEGSDDPNALDLVHNRLGRGQLVIVRHEGHRLLQAFRIGGTDLLLSSHFFQDLKEGEEFIVEMTGCKLAQSFEKRRLRVFTTLTGEQRDACVYRCTTALPAARPSAHLFISDGELEHCQNTKAAMVSAFPVLNYEANVNCQLKTITRHAAGSAFTLGDVWEHTAQTQKGYCGAILVAFNKDIQGKFLGIHAAGSGKARGWSVVVTRDYLDYLVKELDREFGPNLTPPLSFEASAEAFGLHNAECPPAAANTNLIFVGNTPKLHMPPASTKIRPSDLHNLMEYEPTQDIAVLHGQDPRLDDEHKGMSIVQTSFLEYGDDSAPIDTNLLEHCRDSLVADFQTIRWPKSNWRLLNWEEAISGVPGLLEPMDPQKSAGLPWKDLIPRGSDKKGKLEFLIEQERMDESRPKTYLPGPALLAALEERESSALEGNRVPSLSLACIKDERLKKSKIPIGRTRNFTCMPMDYNILLRKYFGMFTAFMHANWRHMSSKVGINVHGTDWTELFKILTANGEDRFEDYDFGHWDRSLPAELFPVMAEIVSEMYGDRLDSESHKVRRVLMAELVQTYIVCLSNVFVTTKGIKSGCAMTSELNCLAKDLLMYYCFRKIYPQYSYSIYKEECQRASYGDDEIVRTSEKIEAFNGNNLQKEFAKLRMNLTPAEKGLTVFNRKTIWECTFLKRTWSHLGGTRDLYLAPLDINVVREIALWIQKSRDHYASTCVVALESLREAFYHGRTVYQKHRSALIAGFQAMSESRGIPYLPLYEEAMKTWLDTIDI